MGTEDGDPVNGQGLGQNGSGDADGYGAKVSELIQQNWRIDHSMNGKKVVVTDTVKADGTFAPPVCQGDQAVCKSAVDTLNLLGMLPRPPSGCKDCSHLVISMTPKI